MSVVVSSVPSRRLRNLRVVGYVHDGRVQSLAGPDAAEERIRELAAYRSWEVLTVIHDWDGARPDSTGDGLAAALSVLAARDADALAVASLEELDRPPTRVADLLEHFTRCGWILILASDSTDVFISAEEMIHDLRAQREAERRRTISAHTKEAIERKRAAGQRIGGPRRCPDAVLDRVLSLRDAGARLAEIAEAMNEAGLPTPGGGNRWWPSHVSRLLKTQDAQTRSGKPSQSVHTRRAVTSTHEQARNPALSQRYHAG
jgi:DNA invertase Pin-like site-specific DNA recombinase